MHPIPVLDDNDYSQIAIYVERTSALPDQDSDSNASSTPVTPDSFPFRTQQNADWLSVPIDRAAPRGRPLKRVLSDSAIRGTVQPTDDLCNPTFNWDLLLALPFQNTPPFNQAFLSPDSIVPSSSFPQPLKPRRSTSADPAGPQELLPAPPVFTRNRARTISDIPQAQFQPRHPSPHSDVSSIASQSPNTTWLGHDFDANGDLSPVSPALSPSFYPNIQQLNLEDYPPLPPSPNDQTIQGVLFQQDPQLDFLTDSMPQENIYVQPLIMPTWHGHTPLQGFKTDAIEYMPLYGPPLNHSLYSDMGVAPSFSSAQSGNYDLVGSSSQPSPALHLMPMPDDNDPPKEIEEVVLEELLKSENLAAVQSRIRDLVMETGNNSYEVVLAGARDHVPNMTRAAQLKSAERRRRAAEFSCILCDYLLTTKSNLKNHYRSHMRFSKWSCDRCGQMFRTDSTLKRHKESTAKCLELDPRALEAARKKAKHQLKKKMRQGRFSKREG